VSERKTTRITEQSSYRQDVAFLPAIVLMMDESAASATTGNSHESSELYWVVSQC